MTDPARGATAAGTTALALLLALVAPACGRSRPGETGTATAPAAEARPAPPPETPLEPAPEATPLPVGLEPLVRPFTGDLDGMVKRRMVRVLTVQNPVFYFVDRGRQVGLTYEAVQAFEKELNRKLGNTVVRVYAVLIPVGRDQLLPMLEDGRGDIAVASLTITPERRKRVDFSEPVATGIREHLVTGPGAPPVTSVDDLSGRQVYVRPSSSYAEHLAALNRRFAAAGRPGVEVLPAPEVLEDGDILEMVNAGLVPATVVDGFMADLYVQIFPGLRKHGDVASPPGDIGWAFRKNSPQLAAAVNEFLKTHEQGTLAGNVLIDKYLKTTKWLRSARSDEDRRRFLSMVELFRTYGGRYGLDPLLMAAQGYQESGLDQAKRSRAGAIGVMQLLPSTARDKAVGIPDIEKLESNIHAGVKYNRWMIDTYYDEPGLAPLDRMLLAFASYNAGPRRVALLRQKAKAQGLDPDRWFNNVELVAAKEIGRETVTYVSNIYRYYLAYQMMVDGEKARREAKAARRG